MKFTPENTSGYTYSQLVEINYRWAAIAKTLGLERGSDKYGETLGRFRDAVNHCNHIAGSNIDWVTIYVRMDLAAELRDSRTLGA